MFTPNRRTVLAGAASVIGSLWTPLGARADEFWDPSDIYAAVEGEPFPVPAINLKRINPEYYRTVVEYPSNEEPGTLIIDPSSRHLYVINGDGRAIRYGVGVGREGFLWSGDAKIQAKREWPDWYPPKEMIARDPSVRRVMQNLQGGLGMPGGPGNPLGARAMYLYQNGKDTLYRIHGTIEPWTIGSRVSSGCIRMINQDVLDLYSRIPLGSKVVVLGNAHPDARMAQRRVSPDHQAIPDTDNATSYRRSYEDQVQSRSRAVYQDGDADY